MIKDRTPPLSRTLGNPNNYEDYDQISHHHRVPPTPITTGFASKADEKRHKPEVVHDPYWSMMHRLNNKGNTKPRIQVPDPTYMTIREVADLLRVSQLTVKRWSNKGDLACVRINSRGDRRYLRSEINKLLGGTA